LFNWQYAQLLASERMLCAIEDDHRRLFLPYDTTLGGYRWGDTITPQADSAINFRHAVLLAAQAAESGAAVVQSDGRSEASEPSIGKVVAYLPVVATRANMALFFGWSAPVAGGAWRWTTCEDARVVFRLNDAPTAGRRFVLHLEVGVRGARQVIVLANGREIGTVEVTMPPESPQSAEIAFEGQLLQPGALNEVTIRDPDAAYYGLSGRQSENLALLSMTLAESK
jgi:hypothetical protein